MSVTSVSLPKRWLGMRPWFVVLLVCVISGLLILVSSGISSVGYIPHEKQLRDLTLNLPDVERIEIELVHVNFETINKVIDTKTLVGPETKELEDLWRSQSYTFDGHVMCHAPIYRIRFYKSDALLTEATVCFHCHNIYFYKHAGAEGSEEPLDATFSFSSDDAPYMKLRDYLSNLFPGHDVEAESSKKPN